MTLREWSATVEAISTPRFIGTGMHDQRIGLGAGELLVVEAEEVVVLAYGGHVVAFHALALEAQHHDDVGTFQALPHVGEDFRAERSDTPPAATSKAR